MWPAGLEPAPRRVSDDRSTAAELRPRGSGQGWIRTSSLLCVRQALCAIELLARVTPGQGFEPRPPRSERGVLASLDDPGRKRSVVHATRPRFDPGSLRRCRYRASSWRRSGARRSSPLEKCVGKSSRHICSFNYRFPAGEDLSLSGGASMSFSVFFKLGITSLVR
jgi:hypothetical protein